MKLPRCAPSVAVHSSFGTCICCELKAAARLRVLLHCAYSTASSLFGGSLSFPQRRARGAKSIGDAARDGDAALALDHLLLHPACSNAKDSFLSRTLPLLRCLPLTLCRAVPRSGRSPLHRAAEQGHLKMARLLLAAGAHVDAKSRWLAPSWACAILQQYAPLALTRLRALHCPCQR